MGSLHARNFGTFAGRARVTAVHDPDRDRAAALAAEVGAIRVDDLEATLSAPDLDAVAVCVPPALHRQVVELALARGKHVFLEKPIATTRADADAIIDSAERHKRLLMVGLVLRFWPGYPELYQRVASGDLGRPLAITCRRLQPPPSSGGWVADITATGGIAPFVLVHDFDQMNWFFGKPRSASAQPLRGAGASASHVIASIRYAQGTGLVEGSVSMPRSHPFSVKTQVICEHGSAEYGFDVHASSQDNDRRSKRDESRFTPLDDLVITVYRDDSTPPEIVTLPKIDPWRPELDHFLTCLEHRHGPRHGTPKQARDALDVALAVNRSLDTGQEVPIEPR